MANTKKSQHPDMASYCSFRLLVSYAKLSSDPDIDTAQSVAALKTYLGELPFGNRVHKRALYVVQKAARCIVASWPQRDVYDPLPLRDKSSRTNQPPLSSGIRRRV
ncbi:hypothetical protein LSAT2_021663 [Lamellibrachia satsuma]|nr:hypothetical protein LSAT2_021663 [Lamellibrachia satsuma]